MVQSDDDGIAPPAAERQDSRNIWRTGRATAVEPIRTLILTPDQRLRVFISSTLEEMEPDRRAAEDAIENLHLTPVMFERGARPYPPRALYRAYLEQSDVFLGLYWERYGWVAPGEEVSGLEDEYGLSGDRPKLIYIKKPAPNREPRLSKLIGRIQRDDRVSYKPFKDSEELRAIVADDLVVLLTERFAASATPPVEPSLSEMLTPPPRPPTRLIGRDDEVRELLNILAAPDSRVVTIVGPGGIGKSRLALEVARQANDRFSDGIAYVEFAAITEPALVLPTIAKALGIQERTGGSIETQLQNRLAHARMLIVLDNLEQLSEAAAHIAEVVSKTDALQLLVTSRRMLHIRAEHVFALDPLEVPAADGSITPAVELFVEQARRFRPNYQPNDEDMAAIAELTRRLDGLPLAIELASARVRLMSPASVLDRMGYERLDFLGAGPSDLPARQRTLRNTIAWSHSLLSSESQLFFARLAVFVGSADLKAIEQVTNPDGGSDTLDPLADLLDQSLIRATGEAADPRFGMLQTIRDFAMEQLQAGGEAADYLSRHETYYLDIAERGNAALGTAEQVEWLDRFGRENDNLRAVMRRAIRRNDAATALRMGRALATYWNMCGSHGEGRGWMEQVGSLPSAGPRERAVAWLINAIQAFWQGQFELLGTGLDDAARLAGGAEDQRTVAFARLLQAMGSATASDDERQEDALEDASRRLEAEGEPLAIGFGLLARSHLARTQGRMEEARRLAQAAYDQAAPIGESFMRMIASVELAHAEVGLGETSQAERHAAESLRAARRLHNLNVAAYALELWAAAELRDGRIEYAGWLLALSDRSYRQAGSHPWRTTAELHDQVHKELQVALGDRYKQILARARNVDLDDALTELISAQPSAH